MLTLRVGEDLSRRRNIGTTNANGEQPASKATTPGCVLSTMYHVLGIDYRHAFYDQAQRPLAILNEDEPIAELIG